MSFFLVFTKPHFLCGSLQEKHICSICLWDPSCGLLSRLMGTGILIFVLCLYCQDLSTQKFAQSTDFHIDYFTIYFSQHSFFLLSFINYVPWLF